MDRAAISSSKFGGFALWLTLSLACTFALSTLAARRLVRPLAGLAAAVDQFGGRGDVPAPPPVGPREVRGTIEAINRLQARPRRFNDDRTRMIAGMSHDLRTPLTRLRLRLEMIEDQEGAPRMLAEIDRMSVVIESMLAFARDDIEHEPQSLVDLAALVEGICEDATDAGTEVSFTGSRDVTLFCRPGALRRACSNVIENAAKYGGRPIVTLSAEANRVVITVDDEGPGIPRHERGRAFQPFVRLDRSCSVGGNGVGLGLAVARSIVLEHGGEIILSTRKEGGLSVRIEVPLGKGGDLS